MSAIEIGAIVFGCVFAGSLFGMYLRTVLPEPHLSADTKDVVKLAIALIATMAALVVSLLISSAKTAYDTRRNELMQASADIVVFDRVLAHYGPESKDARALLRQGVAAAIERLWPADGTRPMEIDLSGSRTEALYEKISATRAAKRCSARPAHPGIENSVGPGAYPHTAVCAGEQLHSCTAFLIVVVFWLTMILGSFGLFAPANVSGSDRFPDLLAVDRRRDLSDPGTRPIFRRADPYLKCAAASGAHATRPISPRLHWERVRGVGRVRQATTQRRKERLTVLSLNTTTNRNGIGIELAARCSYSIQGLRQFDRRLQVVAPERTLRFVPP